VVVWGASGHAIVVSDILQLSGYELEGYLDDINTERCGESFGGAKVLGGREQLASLSTAGVRHMAIGVGDNIARLALAKVVRNAGFSLLTAVHPRAMVSASAQLGEGIVVAAGAVINPACNVGSCTILNTASSIDHECSIGDGVHIAPGVHMAACVNVGRGTFIGVGSAVCDRVRIGAGTIVGAGSVVLKDIPDGVVAYGVPARVIRSVGK
jgi:acetyltransferase EpsM